LGIVMRPGFSTAPNAFSYQAIASAPPFTRKYAVMVCVAGGAFVVPSAMAESSQFG
jgi:hypothetical protein